MDPVTSFSLAAGILQVVDVSSRVLAQCWELCRDGSLAEHRETVKLTDALVSSTRRLNATTSQVATPRTQDDIEIVKLSAECTKVAEDLLVELRKFRLEQSGLWHALTKSVRILRRKAILTEKQELLEKYRRDLKSLEQGVQSLALGLEQGHNTVAQILADGNRQLKEHIDMKFDSHAKATEDRIPHTRLLESLFFPDIVAREEQISDAFEGTCRWIFDSSDDQESNSRPWSNFRKWLETETGVYWISGKPGSGKSTLMKYILKSERTPQLLADWEKGTDLIVVSFFFWNPGMALQKSCTGLLRSLLYQIATQWPALADLAVSPTGRSKDAIDGSRSWNPLTTWTDQGLMSLLNRFLDEKPANISLCAFVDGLDEFVGDEDFLLHMIGLLNNSSRCKICVSSRPEQAFCQEFRLCPQLRVQDLNREDIKRTVAGKLRPSLQKHSALAIPEIDVRSLIRELVEKASGVFLWLDLMTKDLIKGSRDGDTVEELHSRLARTPDTINGLYAHMLQKLDQRYVKECVQYCSILMMAEELRLEYPITLLTLALGEHESWNHLVDFDLTYFAESRFIPVCQVLESRITSRCGGLLEIGNYRQYPTDQKATMQCCDRKVNFVHRTAMEYVQTVYQVPSVGSWELLEAQAQVARGSLGLCILLDTGYHLWGSPGLEDVLWDSMLAISTMFSTAVPLDDNRSAKSLQIDLLDQACQTLQNLYYIKEPDSATQFFFDGHGFSKRYFGDWGSDSFHCMLNNRLNFAAFYGCHHYVQSCLSTETYSADQMSALFQVTIAGLEYLLRLGPMVYSVCLLRLVTIQVILQRGLDLDLNGYFGGITVEGRLTVSGTPFGRLFYTLLLATRICQERDESTVQRRYTDMRQRCTACCFELTQKLLSLGANPNTRLIVQITLWTRGGALPRLFVSYSLLSLLENSQIKNQALKACFYSAGAIHYKSIRFVQYDDYYWTNDAQSQLLDQLLMDFEPDWELAASFLHLEFEISAEESVREVLDSIAEKQPISEEDILTALNESGEFN
ncbi:MAG: hypothetical protein L6R36_008128 [Xanthoria steineri]|nr:MAG: hypothetical protein L6R36_008128 [Xanthoria steineri]